MAFRVLFPAAFPAFLLASSFVASGLLTPNSAYAQNVNGPETASEGSTLEAEARPSVLAQFTSAVENREPVDQITFVANDVRKIIFFTDLRGLGNQTVTHRWIYNGETTAEVPFQVRGPRWRVWSSKKMLEELIGDWTVEIVSEAGEVIAAETFTYSQR